MKGIKNYNTGIAGVGELQTILEAVDNFTGSVEDAEYRKSNDYDTYKSECKSNSKVYGNI
ncbi:MAG: hypothetical protein ACRCW0_06555 [Clostridium sp.]